MSKQYWDYERLNKEMSKIEQAGYQMPTRLYRIQEGRTTVVVDNTLPNSGHIRSYDEARAYVERKEGSNFKGYTREEYDKTIRDLQDALGKERSYQGEIRAQRAQLHGIVEDMNKALDRQVDPSLFTTKELYDAVKEANNRVKESNAKSPQFYEYLIDILENISDVPEV